MTKNVAFLLCVNVADEKNPSETLVAKKTKTVF